MTNNDASAKKKKHSSSALKDRNYKGEDFHVDQAMEHGPLEDRKATDIFCCGCYIVFFCGMIACIIMGFLNGEPDMLMAPVDYNGNICGYSENTVDYPYLYIYDLNSAINEPNQLFQYGVCVKSCPTQTSTIECVNTRMSVNSCATQTPRYGTTEMMDYCLPVESDMPSDMQDGYGDLMNAFLESTGGGVVTDIYVGRWFILLGMAITVVYTLIYIKFMDWCAFGLAWFSILAVGISMILGGFAFFMEAGQDENQSDDSYIWLYFCAASLWVAAILYCICTACNFRSLQISLAVIETAADYFAQTKRILIVPVIFFFVCMIWFFLWLAGFMMVGSVGDITANAGGTQWKNVEWSQQTYTMVWYMIFGLIWTISFWITCNDYVIIVSACTWYFSKKTDQGWEGQSQVSKGFKWIFRYNFGSLAYGSGIIAICAIFREIMEYLGEKIRKASGENCCVKCLVCCCLCCVNCTDRFIRYLTENAYIYMALSGDGFCESALNSFLLMLKNSAKFSFVSSVSSTFMFLAKLSISFLTAYTCYGFMQLSSQMQEFEVNSPTMPLLLVFLFSYTVAAIFMSIFQVGANTILQCFLVDRDIADQKNELDSMMSHVPAALKKFLDGYEQWEAVHDKVDDQEKANELN